MSHVYKLNENVRHQPQGPRCRAEADPPMIYTVVQRMPIEADGRIRYRIKSKSENIERVVTEDQLSYSQWPMLLLSNRRNNRERFEWALGAVEANITKM